MEGRPAFELLEESIAALRCCGLETLLCYYAGSVPFVLGLLYFWAEMSVGAYAERSLALTSLGMSAAYLWMQCWHCIFMNRLLAHVGAQDTVQWTVGRLWRMLTQQALVQSTSLFVLPVALLITLPFGWAVAFYQAFLIEANGGKESLREIMGRAASRAKLWPLQNHIGLATLMLLGILAFVNTLSIIYFTPYFLKLLFGIETAISRNEYLLLNTTVLMIAIGSAMLITDPICKTFYVLRCFYGRSLLSGDDLKTAMRRIRNAALCVIGGFVLCIYPSRANAVDAKKIDQSIDQVLKRPEYAWRAPREKLPDDQQQSFMMQFFTAIGDATYSIIRPIKNAIRDFFKWLDHYLSTRQLSDRERDSKFNIQSSLEIILYLLCGLILAAGAIAAWYAWKNRKPISVITAEAVQAIPDIRSENVTADQLPEDRWVEMARDLARQGEYRLAIRALYLAGLSHLGSLDLVTIARSKSNREFRTELARRARGKNDLIEAFSQSVLVFEHAWYGTQITTPEGVDQYLQNLQRIKLSA